MARLWGTRLPTEQPQCGEDDDDRIEHLSARRFAFERIFPLLKVIAPNWIELVVLSIRR